MGTHARHAMDAQSFCLSPQILQLSTAAREELENRFQEMVKTSVWQSDMLEGGRHVHISTGGIRVTLKAPRSKRLNLGAGLLDFFLSGLSCRQFSLACSEYRRDLISLV